MRLQTALGVFILLFMVGCVRQAGPTFEPIQSNTFPTFTPSGEVVAMGVDGTPTETNLATMVETVAKPTTSTPDAPLTVLATATSALPAITILPPTQTQTPIPNATPTVIVASAQGAGLSTAQPSATPIPPSSTIGISPVDIATSTVVPSATPASAPLQSTPSQAVLTDSSETEDGTTCDYTVVRGDNLYRIAVNNNLTLEELRKANPNLTGDNPIINPGDILSIPCDEQPTETVIAQATSQATALPTDTSEYTVVSGDTLLKIARKYNTTVTELQNLNKLTNPDLLSIGQVILVPNTTPAN
ncbi:MAG: LysM peptidoglycan-binding domain-containing protein [Phototrophicaceae bacterium]